MGLHEKIQELRTAVIHYFRYCFHTSNVITQRKKKKHSQAIFKINIFWDCKLTSAKYWLIITLFNIFYFLVPIRIPQLKLLHRIMPLFSSATSKDDTIDI